MIVEQFDGKQVEFDPRKPLVAGGWKEMTSAEVFKRLGKSRACRYCGQYIENGERYGLIVTNGRCSHIHPNFFIHENEWNLVSEGTSSFEEAVAKLASRPQPRAKNGNREDPVHTAAVRKTIEDLGYRIIKETRSLIFFKPKNARHGEIAPFKYSKKHKHLEFTGKASGIVDRMILSRVMQQIEDRIQQTKEQG